MSEHPRIRRKDPERSAPIRDWSNMFRSSGGQSASAPSADSGAARIERFHARWARRAKGPCSQ